MTTTSTSDDTAALPRRVRRWAVASGLVGIGVGSLATVLVIGHADVPSQDPASVRLSDVGSACRDWMSSGGAADRDDQRWCTDMVDWMGAQAPGSMMDVMTWQEPRQVLSACRAWADRDTSGASAADGQRCTDMAAWMDDHLSGRTGTWMMHDR